MVGQARDARDGALVRVEDLQLRAVFEVGERGDGVVGQMQLLERLQGGQGGEVGDGVVGKVEELQLLQADQGVDVDDGAAGEVQARQLRQGDDGAHRRRRERAAGQVQRAQRRQLGEDRQVHRRAAMVQRERAQAGEVRQILQRGDGIGQVQLLDGPELVRHQRAASRLAEQLTDIAVQPRVRQRDRLHDAADGIAGVDRVAHEAVVRHAQRDDLALARGQGDGAGIDVRLFGREIAVADGVDGALGPGDGDIDVFRIGAALRLDHGCGGAQGVDLGADGVVGDAAEHGLGVKELVLLHVGLGQGDVEVGRVGALRDGVDEGIFGLRIVAASLVSVREPDGKLGVLRGEVHGELVAGDGAAIAAVVIKMIAPVGKHALRQIAAGDKEKVARADQQREDQQDRDQYFQRVFHTETPF